MIEPGADYRQFAAMCFQQYTALIQAGFTEDQALELVRELIRPRCSGGGGDRR